MSANNFSITTKAIYNIFHVAWILMIGLFLIMIIKTIVQPTDISVPIIFNINDAGHLTGLENSKISITNAEGLLKYDEAYQPSLMTIIAYHSKVLLKGALLLYILSQIRIILKTASKHNTFNNNNSQRLLKIGWAILAIGLLHVLTTMFSYYSFDVSHLNLDKNVDCNCSDSYKAGRKIGRTLSSALLNPSLYIGLATIALSTAFKTGSTMKEEVDLTI